MHSLLLQFPNLRIAGQNEVVLPQEHSRYTIREPISFNFFLIINLLQVRYKTLLRRPYRVATQERRVRWIDGSRQFIVTRGRDPKVKM
jgi:hypothetical protein